MIYIPDNVQNQIFLYCDATTLAQCYFVSKRCNSEAGKAVKYILKFITEKYYSRSVFENRYFIRPDNLTFLQKLTQTRIFVVRGIVTYFLNINDGQWKRCADTMRDRGYFAAVWFRGEIFAIGTYSIIAAGTVEKYNTLANCWIHGPSLPLKIRSACAAVLDDKLYVLGGHDAFSMVYHDTVFIYDDRRDFNFTPDGNKKCGINNDSSESWILSETRLLRPRSRHAAVGFEGRIWIAGGSFENQSIITRSVEIFDPKTALWITGPSLTTSRDFSNLLVVLGSLYAVGGDVDDEGNPATRTIEVYDKALNVWKHVTAFKDERMGFSTSSFESKIYIFGGSSDVSYELNTWDAFDVCNLQWDSDINLNYEKMPLIDCWGQAVTAPPVKMLW